MGELIGNLIGQGVRHIAIINTGVSTEAPVRIVCRGMLERHGISIPTADMSCMGRDNNLLQQKVGGHADEHETSIMLAIDPSQVTLSRAAVDYGNALDRPANVFHRPGTMSDSRSGAFGDPSLATRAKCEAILAAMTEDLLAGLMASFPETLGSRGK